MSILSKLSIVKRILFNHELIISYKMINKVKNTSVGYIDIESVAKRYYESTHKLTLKQLMKHSPVIDLTYFINRNRNLLLIKDKGKILDVGCGGGAYSLLLDSKVLPFRNYTYSGCEIDERLVKICNKIFPKHKFFTSTAQKINAKNNEYNTVICSGTLHYTLDSWKNAITEMKRVSKDNIIITRLPITKYNKSFYVEQSVRSISGNEKHFFQVYNLEELEREFKRNGLKLLARDYSMEEYPISGVNERIVLNNFLLSHEK